MLELKNMTNYDFYNREERAICSHLFRLLHEHIEKKADSPLAQFLKIVFEHDIVFKNGHKNFADLNFDRIAIYCEVSLLRDAYQNRKPHINSFMDNLTRLIMNQENIQKCRLFTELPKPLNDIKVTHPNQIIRKANSEHIELSNSENIVYASMQGMFNAKPDLVLIIDDILLVCEAKFTERFDEKQFKRTLNIAEIWSTLLYEDLGFKQPPIYSIFKLGASYFKPEINWTEVIKIAEKTYRENDRTRIAIKAGVELLRKMQYE
ncbi:hypothetical protein AGMMS4957_10910 [Bacteroidia bacterium]|nr:hypothetical protein AGMMS4957_10910 [Bacteroidia bacterium]